MTYQSLPWPRLKPVIQSKLYESGKNMRLWMGSVEPGHWEYFKQATAPSPSIRPTGFYPA